MKIVLIISVPINVLSGNHVIYYLDPEDSKLFSFFFSHDTLAYNHT